MSNNNLLVGEGIYQDVDHSEMFQQGDNNIAALYFCKSFSFAVQKVLVPSLFISVVILSCLHSQLQNHFHFGCY